jgi:DNA-binding GntR family transcriptional regulator
MPILKFDSFTKPILREEVYTSIKEAILTGEVVPGERLSIGRLLKDIRLSHTPIREALLKLEQEGFVSRLPTGGFIASQLSRKDIEEILDIRSLLESYAVSFAIDQASERDIAALENNVKESANYLRKKKIDQVSRLNTQFHYQLSRFCGNERLLALITDLNEKFFQYRSVILGVPALAQVSVDQHKRMIDALRKKDPAKLKNLVQQHISESKKVVLKAIDSEVSIQGHKL